MKYIPNGKALGCGGDYTSTFICSASPAGGSMNNLKIRNICLKHIDVIFDDLVRKGLIDPESNFFSTAKQHAFKLCLHFLHPLIELSDVPSETHFDFFLHNSSLVTYTFFLDQSLDSLVNSQSTKVRSYQISAYLLLDYFRWLIKAHKSKLPLFYEYYKEQTNYLIIEKKWEYPQIYLSTYSSVKEIYKKEIILLFPLELYKITPLLKKLFTNYFSFISLADDLIDITFDINHHCLTYPIAMYYKLKGALPHSCEDLTPIIPQIVKILQDFLINIKKLEEDSLIIKENIFRIKSELSNRGIEL